ncbi:MAG: globin family protein [Cyanobacteria bacterium P01_E01_bin.42]
MAIQTELLEASFALLQERKTSFTDRFYTTLFADYPVVKPLFAHVDMNEQPKKLFASLVLVVNNLTKPDVLTDALKGLGTRHIKYGVLPEHYPMVGNTLIKSMAVVLADRWTDEIAGAWTEAYAAIVEIMLEGADYAPEILAPFNSADLP